MYFLMALFIIIICITIVAVVRSYRVRKSSGSLLDGKQFEDALENGFFSLQETCVYEDIAIVCVGLHSFFLVFSLFMLYWHWHEYDPIYVIGCCFFFLTLMGSVIVFLICHNWKISVEKDKIAYRNFLGQVKNYNFKEIVVRKDRRGRFLAYQNNKKIFSIDSNIVGNYIFLWWANEFGVYKDR